LAQVSSPLSYTTQNADSAIGGLRRKERFVRRSFPALGLLAALGLPAFAADNSSDKTAAKYDNLRSLGTVRGQVVGLSADGQTMTLRVFSSRPIYQTQTVFVPGAQWSC
jgi:hypothetical protein